MLCREKKYNLHNFNSLPSRKSCCYKGPVCLCWCWFSYSYCIHNSHTSLASLSLYVNFWGLQEESTTKSLIAQEAEEHKDLWEKEVISRSKLGLRVRICGAGCLSMQASITQSVLNSVTAPSFCYLYSTVCYNIDQNLEGNVNVNICKGSNFTFQFVDFFFKLRNFSDCKSSIHATYSYSQYCSFISIKVL